MGALCAVSILFTRTVISIKNDWKRNSRLLTAKPA